MQYDYHKSYIISTAAKKDGIKERISHNNKCTRPTCFTNQVTICTYVERLAIGNLHPGRAFCSQPLSITLLTPPIHHLAVISQFISTCMCYPCHHTVTCPQNPHPFTTPRLLPSYLHIIIFIPTRSYYLSPSPSLSPAYLSYPCAPRCHRAVRPLVPISSCLDMQPIQNQVVDIARSCYVPG